MAKKRLKLGTPKEIKASINKIANLVLNDELEAKNANAILYACNVALGTIRTDEQQKKLEELEALIEERGGNV